MNPLFRNATRALKAALRAEVRTGQLGQMMAAVQRRTVRKGQAARYMKQIARKIRGGVPPERLAALPGWSERTEKYAKRQGDREVMDQIFRALGPAGEFLKTFLRPTGRALTNNQERELQAMSKLLRAFGWEVIPPPPKRGGLKAEIAATSEYLGKLGFKVVPTNTGYPIKGLPAQPKLQPLPGWVERLHQQQKKPDKPGNPPRQVRSTVDVDFGEGRQRRIKLNDPILTGEMIPVVSSNVHSIGFDINHHSPMIGTLKVRFLQSHGATARGAKVAGPLYFYYNVPSDVFRRFQKAVSKGAFVWDNLRIRGTVSGHKFDYSLQGIARGYVPRKATFTHEGEAYVKRTFLGQSNKTGEKRLFHSRESALVRPFNGRPDNGRPPGPNRGRN